MKKIFLLIIHISLLIPFSFGQFGSENIIAGKSIGVSSVFSCDINGDGHMDILSASRNDNKIAWYENDGLGHIGIQKIISTEAVGACSVYASDLDGDGDMDVLSASMADDKVAWYKNDGLGQFSLQQTISESAAQVRSVYASDLDGDGDMDVLSASSNDDKIAWYENNGFGQFGSQQIISNIADHAFDVYTSDLDGDGDMDVLSASSNDDKIAWYENDGFGQFESQQIRGILYNSHSIFSADLDDDGDMDVIAASFGFKIVWYENNGSGNFSSEQIITTDVDGVNSIYSEDLDGDGDMDILSCSTYDNKVAWYKNDGLGQFGIQQIITTQVYDPNSVFTQDIDGDGKLDVLYSSFGDNKIAWQTNDGLGNFGAQNIITISNSTSDTYTSDLDGDGDLDVISASGSDIIAWYENDGLGQFGIQQIISDSADNARSVKSADLDNDGDMDVLSASFNDHKIAWYENDSFGTFTLEHIISTSASPSDLGSIHISDLNGDGNLDILSANYSYDEIVWFENDGLGNYSTEQLISNDVDGPESIYSGDLDGDGDMDVLSVSRDDDKIAWYENDGTGQFGIQQIIISTAIQPHFIYTDDLDGDGDMDVLSAFGTKITCYRNGGSGQFGSEEIITNFVYLVKNITTNDIDGDGDIDIISSSYSSESKVAWYENDGQGNFGEQKIISSNTYNLRNVSSGDIDGDGDMDVIAGFDGKITWNENFFGSIYKLKGNYFFDANQNGLKDTNEYGFGFSQLELHPNALASYTNQEGGFWFAIDTGSYILSYQTLENWGLTTDSSEYHVHLGSNEPIIDSLDFGFFPSVFITDINPEIIASPFICSGQANYWLSYYNQGTTNPDGIVELALDDSIAFISSEIPPDSIIGQNLYWHFDSLQFFASGQISLVVQIPDFNSMGDTLESVLNIYTTDSTGQFLFTDTISEFLACSYDPNDKLVTPIGEGPDGIISKDERLEYTVRFQNTGNAEAINIKIRDQIDANLDIQSIEILAASHDVQSYIQQNRWLVFQFDSILLPDSTSNELESHGFVKYSITIDEAVLPNSKIFNSADIYFDYNPAVLTNTAMNTIECYITPEAPEIFQEENILQVETQYDLQWILNGIEIVNASDTAFQFTENGDYSIIVTDGNGCSSISETYTVTGVNIDYIESEKLRLYPNPANNFVKVVSSDKTASVCKLYNMQGRLFMETKMQDGKTNLNLSQLSQGFYIVKVGNRSHKLSVE